MAEEEKRTLYITGFPPDTREREVRNMFRFHAGFEAAKVNSKGEGSPIASFVLFKDAESASAAKDLLDKTPFDLGSPQDSPMSVSLAKTNLDKSKLERTQARSRKEEKGPSTLVPSYSQQQQQGGGLLQTGYYMPSVDPQGALTSMLQSQIDLHQTPSYPSVIHPALQAQGMSSFLPTTAPQILPYSMPQPNIADTHNKRQRTEKGGERDSRRSSQACTLYVSNIDETANEFELKALFSDMSGFVASNVISKGSRWFVFAQFADNKAANAALKAMDGHKLVSAPNTGLRVQLSRTEFRAGAVRK